MNASQIDGSFEWLSIVDVSVIDQPTSGLAEVASLRLTRNKKDELDESFVVGS